jgi:hypothetical protein
MLHLSRAREGKGLTLQDLDGYGSGVDLIKRMPPKGDLKNARFMFDHVKCVQA